MENITLIANSGIQLASLQVEINVQERSSLMFYETYNNTNDKRSLDLVHEIKCDDEVRVYKKANYLKTDLSLLERLLLLMK
jgi:hypothetical protein